MSDAPASPKTPTKEDEKPKTPNGLTAKKFDGEGVSFKAKLIGMEDLSVDRDEKICLDSMFKLKAVARARGEHKQRIQLNLTMNAVKIIDEITKTQTASHEIERISFVVIDPRDNRAFGYIYNTSDDRHQFWAIKTERAAAATVLALKDLFELAFDDFIKKTQPEPEPTSVKKEEPPVPVPEPQNVKQEPQPPTEKEPDLLGNFSDTPINPVLTAPTNPVVPTFVVPQPPIPPPSQPNTGDIWGIDLPPSLPIVPPAAPSTNVDPIFDLFSNPTPSQIVNAPIQPVQPTFPAYNTVVQPQVFPQITPIPTPPAVPQQQPNLLTPTPTSPVAPPTVLNPLADLDFFGGLTLGPGTTKTTKDAFFPSTGPTKTIQQMQMEKQS